MNTSKPQLLNSSFVYVLSPADFFFQNKLFENFFQNYHQSVKQFGYRQGLTFCLV